MDLNQAKEIFERYRPYFESLNACIYSGSKREDILMLHWWITLSETGDINRLIVPDSRRLPRFLAVFKQPTTLIYSLGPTGEIDNAFWATPVDGDAKRQAAHCGMWTDPRVRGKRRQYNFGGFIYTFIFEFYEALLGTTWQQDLLAIHQKLGYNIVGCIPGLYDEDFVYIVHLTREAFQQSRFVRVGNRR